MSSRGPIRTKKEEAPRLHRVPAQTNYKETDEEVFSYFFFFAVAFLAAGLFAAFFLAAILFTSFSDDADPRFIDPTGRVAEPH